MREAAMTEAVTSRPDLFLGAFLTAASQGVFGEPGASGDVEISRVFHRRGAMATRRQQGRGRL